MSENSAHYLNQFFSSPNLIIYLYLSLIIGFFLESIVIHTKRNLSGYWGEALSNLGVILLHQVGKLLFQLPLIGIYFALYEHLRIFSIEWSFSAFFIAVFVTDFIYYWHHRFMHKAGILWAVHAVHHQPKFINLSMATRLSFFNKIFTYWFYLPMALLGFPPLMAFAAGLIDTSYQALTHSNTLKFPSWFSWILISPQDHHCHHSSEETHFNRNLGGLFSIWDRLFGTWLPHHKRNTENMKFGLNGPLGETDIVNHPIRANLRPFQELFQNARAKGLRAFFW